MFFFLLQNLLSIRSGMGQLHAQLSASKQGHPIWGEDLHHSLSLSGGTIIE